jgi:ketosteroid isomerase-like protein
MSAVRLNGGSAADQKRILERLDEYLVANANFDSAAVQHIWSGAADAVFFNLNGHTYHGREHWARLWQYYRDKVESSYWTPFDIGGVVGADLAVVWCHRHTRSEWQSGDPMPSRPYGTDFVSRATMVFRKEDGDWRVVHAHFSPASNAPRPGGI